MGDDEAEKQEDRTGTNKVLNLLGSGEAVPTFTVLAGRDSVGMSYTLDLPELIIGRAADAHLRIEDEGVSRHHARLTVSGAVVSIEDLNSKNGTLVNGEPILRAELNSGDKIQIGPHAVLRYAVQDRLEAEAQKKLFDQATRDLLTGLYNRSFLAELLAKEFAFTQRHTHPLVVLLLDVDRFKAVNDQWGHAGGDYVLRTLAELLLTTLRLEDVVGRWGGEEFLVMTRQLTEGRAFTFAERVRKAVQKHVFTVGKVVVPVTVSIGVAHSKRAKFKSWEALVDAADHRLYEAKRGGRNRVEPRVARASAVNPALRKK